MSALSTLVHRFFVRLVRNYVGKYPSTSASAESLLFFFGGGGALITLVLQLVFRFLGDSADLFIGCSYV